MDNTRIALAYVFAKYRTSRWIDFYQIHVCNDTQYHAFGHKMSPKSSKRFLSYGELNFRKKIKEKTFKFTFVTYLHQRPEGLSHWTVNRSAMIPLSGEYNAYTSERKFRRRALSLNCNLPSPEGLYHRAVNR